MTWDDIRECVGYFTADSCGGDDCGNNGHANSLRECGKRKEKGEVGVGACS